MVTVTATATDSSATVEILDDEDTAIADADTRTGHQVSLAVGHNTIKARVTAEDGSTEIYTIFVTRASDAILVVQPTALTITEDGTDTFTVRLGAQPTETVTVSVSSSDTSAATLSAANLTFTSGTWNTAQTVTVYGVNDSDTDNEDVTITLRAAGGEYADQTGTVQVTVTDDDSATPELVVFPPSLTVGEGATGRFTVKLATLPTASVTVSVSSDDTGAATVSPSSLTFTADEWDDTQAVTVTGVVDADTNDEPVSISLTASGGDYGAVAGSVAVTVTDSGRPQPCDRSRSAYRGRGRNR